MKKKLFSIGFALILMMSFAIGVSADDSDVNKSNTVDATLESGGFDLQTSSVNSFGDIVIGIDDVKYSTSFEDDFIVKDLRGLDEDWELSVSATTFTNGKHSYNNVLSISSLDDIVREGSTANNDVPSKGITSETILDDGDVLIAKSDDGSGSGQFALSFPSEAVHLIVSPDMKEGNYESTLNWNLMSVPTN